MNELIKIGDFITMYKSGGNNSQANEKHSITAAISDTNRIFIVKDILKGDVYSGTGNYEYSILTNEGNYLWLGHCKKVNIDSNLFIKIDNLIKEYEELI